MQSNNPSQTKDILDEILSLGLIKDDARSELLEILEHTRGRKCLVVDSQLDGILNQIIVEGSRFLTDNGVQYFRELKSNLSLEDFISDGVRDYPDSILFLVRPLTSTMRLIAEQIKGYFKLGIRSQFRIYFVPEQSTVCMHLLEEYIGEQEIWERVSFKDYKIGFIPLDSDVLTLENDSIFKQCYADGDLSCLSTVAHGLSKLQSMYGIIPNLKSKGVAAKKVLEKMLHLRVEEEESLESSLSHTNDNYRVRSEIDTMIILDREIDLVSPLVSPLTYEGLVDEILGIEYSRTKVDASLFSSDDGNETMLAGRLNADSQLVLESKQVKRATAGEKIVLTLNNNDSIFAEIRNLSIERLGSYMQEKAIHIRERYAAFKENKDASLAEIHAFVKKIPKLTKDFKSLNQHIHIAELLKNRTDSREFRAQWQGERAMLEGESFLDEIEDYILSDVEGSKLQTVLKLICLQSLTSGGIKAGKYDNLKRLIIQNYGFETLRCLQSLEKAGLIRRKDALVVVETTPIWQLLKKQLRLIDEKVNMSQPEDISYAAAGYAPLLVRVVQMLLKQEHHRGSNLEAMKLMPGPLIEITQPEHAMELQTIITKFGNSEAATSSSSSVGLTLSPSTLLQYTSSVISGTNQQDTNANISAIKGDDYSQDTSEKKIAVVVVIGGITYLELSAIRFLSNNPTFPYRIIVATTKVTNGSKLLESLM